LIIPRISFFGNIIVSGILTLKDSYIFQSPPGQKIPWAKLIWSSSIPPSKSLLLWRILHNKIPTDDCLKLEVAICGGILRDHEALHLGCFAVNIGISTALSSELNGVMFSIEIAFFKGWKTL
jgi:hypothetical protein